MSKMEMSAALAGTLRKLGAVRVRIGPKGIASHWATQFEASVAKEKFVEMGLTNVEAFADNGLVAVFATFPDFLPATEHL